MSEEKGREKDENYTEAPNAAPRAPHDADFLNLGRFYPKESAASQRLSCPQDAKLLSALSGDSRAPPTDSVIALLPRTSTRLRKTVAERNELQQPTQRLMLPGPSR
ncbi:unnamed protein product [Pleuronectes platessa]|uniref:Uncharacterized protein n=1 Tax=Pleuronectes platessa TaxID=8262 RepID=A0A9N7UDP6_PLEPL|nr:unnamed protein product [Pleuronectes platessa]